MDHHSGANRLSCTNANKTHFSKDCMDSTVSLCLRVCMCLSVFVSTFCCGFICSGFFFFFYYYLSAFVRFHFSKGQSRRSNKDSSRNLNSSSRNEKRIANEKTNKCSTALSPKHRQFVSLLYQVMSTLFQLDWVHSDVLHRF